MDEKASARAQVRAAPPAKNKALRVKCLSNGIEPGKKLEVTFYIFLARRNFHKDWAEHIGLFEQPYQGFQ